MTMNNEPRLDDDVDEGVDAISNHKTQFDGIIAKYGLQTEANSSAIADFLTSELASSPGGISAELFATKFGMTPNEAVVFLSWINIGIQFKDRYLGAPAPADLQ